MKVYFFQFIKGIVSIRCSSIIKIKNELTEYLRVLLLLTCNQIMLNDSLQYRLEFMEKR